MEKTVLLIFIFKTLDCVFSTIKSILLYKGKHFASAACNTLSIMMYAVSLIYAFHDNSLSGLIALGVATFIGSYFPAKLMERLEKDQLYAYEITSDTLEAGKEFADMLRDYNVPVSTTAVRDKSLNKVLMCKVYSQSKAASKLIEDLIPPRFKWSIVSSIIAKE
jgi:uncharacterized protein YebE (UPF0316 family)